MDVNLHCDILGESIPEDEEVSIVQKTHHVDAVHQVFIRPAPQLEGLLRRQMIDLEERLTEVCADEPPVLRDAHDHRELHDVEG